jgi:hypothetical protein
MRPWSTKSCCAMEKNSRAMEVPIHLHIGQKQRSKSRFERLQLRAKGSWYLSTELKAMNPMNHTTILHLTAKAIKRFCLFHSTSYIPSDGSQRHTLTAIIYSPIHALLSIWSVVLPRCLYTKNLYAIRVLFAYYTYSRSAQSITTRYLQ